MDNYINMLAISAKQLLFSNNLLAVRGYLNYNRNTKGVFLMSRTAQVSLRIDENLKNRSNLFFESCGISFNQGIQILLKKALREGKIELVPDYSAETLAAMAESEEILANPSKYKSYSSAEEMISDILAEED